MAAGIAAAGLLTLAGCAVEQADAQVDPGTSGSTSPDSSAAASTSTYADGTYVAEATYQAPSGIETVAVTVTLADDAVTTVSTSVDAVDHEAREFQERFASGISAEVVGRDIAGLTVSRVSGSSLTSAGFNTALETIRSEALV
jgi:uncharacterized protein with FMN-binding domain